MILNSIGNHLTEILVPIGAFSMLVLIVYFFTRYQYLTKKAIIEKGIDFDFSGQKKKFKALETGFAILGVGLGLVIAALLQGTTLPTDTKDLLTFALPLLFGGIGLVSAFFIRKKLEGDQQ